MGEVKIMSEQDIKRGYNLKYYNKHKQEILEKLKEKIACPRCGKFISMSNMSKHKKRSGCINTKLCDKEPTETTPEVEKNEIQELKDKILELENKIIKFI